MHTDAEQFYCRFQDLQQYVGWTVDDAARVTAVRTLLEPAFTPLIDDFYAEIARHEGTRKVITGGQAQIERLKQTLRAWLNELFSGRYDQQYVARRWRVGWRHVEIGLDQVYTNAAVSRLRTGLIESLESRWQGEPAELMKTVRSLQKLLDLDLAIIEDAYQTEYLRRQQRVERLAAIGQMAGGVAHELRQPLNVIKTSVYYLLHARNASPEKIREHLQRIDGQVGLADGVISAMANYARLPLPQLTDVPVRDFINQALADNPMPPNITVTVDCNGAANLMTDPAQLRIALGNLLRNARDAMPEGGALSIIARDDGDHVELRITDTGVGIPPENLERIMEPLYTTKPRGMGLGLAITRGIIDKLGGQIHLASEVGKGTTFRIQLPAVVSHNNNHAWQQQTATSL